MGEAVRRELVLASASPFRRQLLEAAGLSITVQAADVDEPAIRSHLGGASPANIATAVASAKAEAVSGALPRALVIGADQVLALGKVIMGKPRDVAEARHQLRELRGKPHDLPTGVVLALAGKVIWRHLEMPSLVMRDFSDEFLERYLAECGEGVCQMVGAYAVEGRGIQLFERIEGDIFAVIGLPLLPLLAELRARGALET